MYEKLSDLQKIQKFFITDRSLLEVCDIFHINIRDITSTDFLPGNATVLNSGSGLRRRFEKMLLHHRPDIRFISLDPSLGIGTLLPDGSYTIQEFGIYECGAEEYTEYIYKPPVPTTEGVALYDEDAIRFDRERKQSALEIPGAIASLATRMPLAEETVDVVFDCMGPIEYLPKGESQEKYFSELKRVLKPSGKIIFSGLNKEQKELLFAMGMHLYDFRYEFSSTWIAQNPKSPPPILHFPRPR